MPQVDKNAEDALFCMRIMSAHETFLSLGTFRLNDGNQMRFWEDFWLGSQPLKT